jgi:hypothetical protein
VSGGFSEDKIYSNCMIVTQTLEDLPEDFFYLCSTVIKMLYTLFSINFCLKDLDDFQALKWMLSKSINKLADGEYVSKLALLNEVNLLRIYKFIFIMKK